jgi:hypothetical protein
MAEAGLSVRVCGPLVPYAEGLRRYLVGIGYAPTSIVELLPSLPVVPAGAVTVGGPMLGGGAAG